MLRNLIIIITLQKYTCKPIYILDAYSVEIIIVSTTHDRILGNKCSTLRAHY